MLKTLEQGPAGRDDGQGGPYAWRAGLFTFGFWMQSVTSIGHDKLGSALDASGRRFVLWCLEALGLHARPDEAGIYCLEIPGQQAIAGSASPHPHAGLAGRRFVFDDANVVTREVPETVERLTFASPLGQWLCEQLRGGAWPVQAAASHQPTSVHELTAQLFAPYQVDEGRIYLAGCSLEDRPFLRLSFFNAQAPAGGAQVVHCFGTSDGQLLNERLIEDLTLDALTPLTGPTRRFDPDVLRQWTEVTSRQFETSRAEGEWLLLAATLVWCKYAEGKLTFTIGARSVDVAFAGWGRLLADRRIIPPPYTCPVSGRSSYWLGATEDGRITAAEGIATCEVSGRRVLVEELERCDETGQRVLPEFLLTCPVTGHRVLSALLKRCAMCQQQVSPRAIEEERCSACRGLTPITKEDPRMARVLDAHPKLDRWRNWKVAETASVQIFVGISTLRRLLIVVDKHTLDVLHVAGGARLSSRWTDATPVQRTEWVG
ncbi:MAG: hypothetical protein ACYC6N_13310 [Pirellulaceae bacterium]